MNKLFKENIPGAGLNCAGEFSFIYTRDTIRNIINFNIMKLRWLLFLICIFTYLLPTGVYSQDINIPDSSGKKKNNQVQKKDWNEFDWGFTTIRFGVAAIMDYAAYSQDETAKAQMDSANIVVKDQWKWRDFRFFWSGKFNTKRSIIWKIGIMYDVAETTWTFRETGLLIGLPEIAGRVFIGRQKEGYSFNKVQNGYSCYGNERQMSLDLIPIMTDGIRFYGYIPKPGLYYSVGAFTNLLYGHNTKFALWEWQLSGRFGWRPIFDEAKNKVLSLGINFRYAQPDLKKIQVRSRPESNIAPYFIDTKKFESDISTAIGWEAHYRSGPFMTGSEGNLYHFKSDQAGNPNFFGANVYASYLVTKGDAWPFLSDNSAFFFVNPKNPLFHGGIGAIELLLQASTFDLNSGTMPGGRFWKITPMINWYLTYNFRFELVYGYGMLDRFHLNGATQFFQVRFQMQVL
jgi:phosphate-selective porin OprO and OprP